MEEIEILNELKKIKQILIDKNKEIEDLKKQLKEEIVKYKPVSEDPIYNSVPIKNPQRVQVIVENKSPSRNYQFAKTTIDTAQKFEKFIRRCVSHEGGKAFIVMPETGAIYADISVEVKDAFMNILMNNSIDGKKIVFKSEGRYFANFSADEICDYLLKEKEQNQ